MKFLTNTYDPSHPFAPGMVTIGRGETQAEAWARQQRWLQGKVIGDPQATQAYSVQELKARNMVGVYAPEGSALEAVVRFARLTMGEATQ